MWLLPSLLQLLGLLNDFPQCLHTYGFFSSVNYSVDVQMTMPKKCFFSTMLACMSLLLPVVWLLLCLLHLLRLLKALPQCSCTRFLCSVAPVMSATTTGVVEGFSTMLTCIMTLCHVYPFMNVTSTGTSEWFSTTYMHKVSLQFEFFYECYKMQNW